MSLILAIEADRRQATLLASIGKRVHAELVIAPTAERGFEAIHGRVPDLILTSALLSPRDDATIATRLRELDAAAAHVQTLSVPVLAKATRKQATGGLLKKLRGSADASTPSGCDPSLFAEQVLEYLQRGAEERKTLEQARKRRKESAPAQPAPVEEAGVRLGSKFAIAGFEDFAPSAAAPTEAPVVLPAGRALDQDDPVVTRYVEPSPGWAEQPYAKVVQETLEAAVPSWEAISPTAMPGSAPIEPPVIRPAATDDSFMIAAPVAREADLPAIEPMGLDAVAPAEAFKAADAAHEHLADIVKPPRAFSSESIILPALGRDAVDEPIIWPIAASASEADAPIRDISGTDTIDEPTRAIASEAPELADTAPVFEAAPPIADFVVAAPTPVAGSETAPDTAAESAIGPMVALSRAPEPLPEPIAASQPVSSGDASSLADAPELAAEPLVARSRDQESLRELIAAYQPVSSTDASSLTDAPEAAAEPLVVISRDPEPLPEPIAAYQPVSSTDASSLTDAPALAAEPHIGPDAPAEATALPSAAVASEPEALAAPTNQSIAVPERVTAEPPFESTEARDLIAEFAPLLASEQLGVQEIELTRELASEPDVIELSAASVNGDIDAALREFALALTQEAQTGQSGAAETPAKPAAAVARTEPDVIELSTADVAGADAGTMEIWTELSRAAAASWPAIEGAAAESRPAGDGDRATAPMSARQRRAAAQARQAGAAASAKAKAQPAAAGVPADPSTPAAAERPAERTAEAKPAAKRSEARPAEAAEEKPAEAPKKKRRKAKPAQDEWGLFDPDQCGFAALLEKLDEISSKDDAA